MKVCKKCTNELEDDKFEWADKAKSYRRNICMICRNTKPRNYDKINSYFRRCRTTHPERFILQDSRKSDRLKGRENDLDVEFIKDMISRPCSYCGETKIRITLDRKDNSIGHLKSNVVPACIRCNYTKRDMPYEAWLLLTDGMRKARETGVFDNWTGSVWK